MPRLISASAGIPLASAKKIRMSDTLRHMMPILDFFGLDIPQTGETPG